jgi:hypothetical protein
VCMFSRRLPASDFDALSSDVPCSPLCTHKRINLTTQSRYINIATRLRARISDSQIPSSRPAAGLPGPSSRVAVAPHNPLDCGCKVSKAGACKVQRLRWLVPLRPQCQHPQEDQHQHRHYLRGPRNSNASLKLATCAIAAASDAGRATKTPNSSVRTASTLASPVLTIGHRVVNAMGLHLTDSLHHRTLCLMNTVNQW